ncbi:hypothetical protein Ndes2526B_g05330 [Nannochloris sp. 'desiccata']|nr:hypothetical protein KSW81_006316 [Chlorella desiccata (nom. nud.)]
MTSLSLRLASLTNLRLQQIRDGVADADECNAYYVFQQSVKFWRCGGEMALVPLRLLNHHLETAQERNEQSTAAGLHELTLKKKLWNLRILLDLFMEKIEHQLKQCPSRSEATFLCKVFRLGKKGLRIWERARSRGKPMAPVIKRPIYRSNARIAVAKRKQAPTTENQEDPSPVTAIDDVPDESGEHDPPAFTRDSSITRLKTRFAIQPSSPLPAIPTLDVFDDSLFEAHNTVRNGSTPPGEDEFAAAAAMVTCKGGGVESSTADGSSGAAATATATKVVRNDEVMRYSTGRPCLVADPSPKSMKQYLALQAALAAEKSQHGEQKAADENLFSFALPPAQKQKREKEKQDRGIAEDIQQEKVCLSI